MKKTAVDFIIEKLAENGVLHSADIWMAKSIEKVNIIDARDDGFDSTYAEYGETPKCYLDGSSEQYYNETFNK